MPEDDYWLRLRLPVPSTVSRRTTNTDTPKVSGKVDLDEVLEPDTYWFDETEFEKKGKTWLIENIAGVGPLFAAEIAERHSVEKLSVPETMQDLLGQLADPSSFAWIYSEQPLTAILERNDVTLLGRAELSPI